MGWLSFFTKKQQQPSPNNLDNHLKVQAYDKTVAAEAPIRGTYPVAGNGPNLLDRFETSHPQLRDASSYDNSAPPPAVPRLHEADRPSTAPSHLLQEKLSRPKSQPGTSARVSREPPKKRHGPYRLHSKKSIDRNDGTNKSTYSVTSSNYVRARSPSVYSTATSPKFGRGRGSSVYSADSGSTRRFVDLLDAQSFIKPSDYYGRVKATGSRDYGEDVADRNITDNHSLYLDSMHAHDFDPHHFSFEGQSDDSDCEQSSSLRKSYSVGSGLRTGSSNSNFHKGLSKKPSSRFSRDHVERNDTRLAQKGRRGSVHSSLRTSLDRPRSASIRSTTRDVDLGYFPDFLREKALVAVKEDLGRDASTSRHRVSSNISPLSDVKLPSKGDDLQSSRSFGRRELSTEINTGGLNEGLDREKQPRSSRSYRGNDDDFHDSLCGLPSLQSTDIPHLKTTRSRLSSKDELTHSRRDRNTVCVSGKNLQRYEFEETMLERGNSARHWSLTSETAGSTESSNPFRPQSGHTTNTSVDLNPHMSVPKITSSQGPLTPGGSHTREYRAEPERHASLHHGVDPELLAGSLANSTGRHSVDYEMDEDRSSIDSFEAPRRSTGEFEKDLLFQGYGFEGSQLPGLPSLFESIPPPKIEPITLPKKQTSSPFKRPLSIFTSSLEKLRPTKLDKQFSTRSLQHAPQPRPTSQLRMPAYSCPDSEDSDDHEQGYESDEMNFDIPFKRSSSSRYNPHGSTRAHETAGGLFEDESGFTDLSHIVHLRHDAKTKERMSSASLRKSRGTGKAPAIYVPTFGLDDPSDYADAES